MKRRMKPRPASALPSNIIVVPFSGHLNKLTDIMGPLVGAEARSPVWGKVKSHEPGLSSIKA